MIFHYTSGPRRPRNLGHSRSAFTLIELLIVVAIILLLAALTLPSLKGILKDQRISQATRLVQGFVESARARAIGSGRPVAAIFERFSEVDGDTGLQTCVRMSIGEVFPPYEGDWANTVGTLVDTDSDGYPNALDVPGAQGASLTAIVTEGDTIQLGGHNFAFNITGTPAAVGTNIRVLFENPAKTPVYNPPNATVFINKEEGRWPTVAGTTNVSFRIYRKPSKSMAGSVVLPRGTCIDLGWSGAGVGGTELATSVAKMTAKRSIYLVFDSRGTLGAVYEFQQSSSTSATDPLAAALGVVHFLIGRTDQVNVSGAPLSDSDDVQSNILDTANKWVSINAFTGRVYSSDVAAQSTTTISVPEARYLAIHGRPRTGN